MRSLSLQIKYIFLSFLQNYYLFHGKYKWDKDPQKTKIVIADKYATELGVAAVKPAITINRGTISWTHQYRNEAQTLKDSQLPTIVAKGDTKLYTDLIQSQVNIQIMAKRPQEVDNLANEIFLALSAYRDDFKPFGIHKRLSLTLSDERPMEINPEITLSSATISMAFVMQQQVGKAEQLYSASVIDLGKNYYENLDYLVYLNGTAVKFLLPVSNPTLSYVDAITLEEVENAQLVYDSAQDLWLVPDGGVIYGYWEVFQNLAVTQLLD